MDVKFSGTAIILTPSAEELPTVAWMFARGDGFGLVQFTVEQFIKQRNDQMVSEQKETLFVDAVATGVVAAPITKKVNNG